MPTDPYVPVLADDEPRNETNLAPGVHIPPAEPWRADRVGEVGADGATGALLGNTGPNVGYAMTLATRRADGFVAIRDFDAQAIDLDLELADALDDVLGRTDLLHEARHLHLQGRTLLLPPSSRARERPGMPLLGLAESPSGDCEGIGGFVARGVSGRPRERRRDLRACAEQSAAGPGRRLRRLLEPNSSREAAALLRALMIAHGRIRPP